MRRRIVILLLAGLVVLAAAVVTAGFPQYRYTSGSAGISVTQTNTNTPFTDNHSGGTTAAFGALWISICSRSTSANTCAYDAGDGIAATTDTRLAPGACVYEGYDTTRNRDGWAAVGAICAAGQTATFDVEARR